MADSLSYRGPDDAGVWVSGPVGFGHRRLSIIDLSPLGHQPMADPSGRFTICFNGEIFNFKSVRDQLAGLGHTFSGGSDTEVMLAAFVEWGVVRALDSFVGMFAFSVWDARERTLHLVRDRLGIKPLFVGQTPDGDLLFGSELKALMADPGLERRIDPAAVVSYLRLGYVPSPASMFAGVIKLPPGHVLTVRSPNEPLDPKPFWSLQTVASNGRHSPFTGDQTEAEEELNRLLREAVGLRMIADVPLGAFLSGGIDSSLVVALMQSQSSVPVRTFTIGFAEWQYDESAHARSIATHLGTDHTERRVTPVEALAVIPSLPYMYDEPLADASQIPTYLVSALARQQVTVALSGDGGDELFGGYERYRFAPKAWRLVGSVPAPIRRAGSRLLRGVVASGFGEYLGGSARVAKGADLLDSDTLESLYRRLISNSSNPVALTTLADESSHRRDGLYAESPHLDPTERMMLGDTMVYLPDDLLTKLDRASMAVSLEGRVPILDHRVVEFAWRLPLAMRQRKRLLRRALARYVPRTLFERPKMGFELPIAQWLRGPLRDWTDSNLNARSLKAGGVFDPDAVRRVLDDHRSGRANAGHLLWSILMFEAWRVQWGASL